MTFDPLVDVDGVVHAVQERIFKEAEDLYARCWSLPNYYFASPRFQPTRPITCLSCLARRP